MHGKVDFRDGGGLLLRPLICRRLGYLCAPYQGSDCPYASPWALIHIVMLASEKLHYFLFTHLTALACN